MLYTRKGDDGTSGLFGTKERLPKDHALYEALGTVDELNSLLGLCRAKSSETDEVGNVPAIITQVQERLFIVQAELAGANICLTKRHVTELESVITDIETYITNPHAFIIPGANEQSALFDYARAVARRAERSVIRTTQHCNVAAQSKVYMNRLSSLLYALARYTAQKDMTQESSPSYI